MKHFGQDKVRVNAGFWLTLESIGVSRQQLAAATALPTAIFSCQVAPTTEQFFQLWRVLPQLADDGLQVGFAFANTIQLSQLPPELFCAALAKDFGGALARVARFKRLCAPELIELVSDGQHCAIAVSWPFANGLTPPTLVDTTFSFLLGLAGKQASADLIARVELTRAQPTNDGLRQHYGDCIEFGCQRDAIVFKANALALPLPSYNNALAQMLLPQLQQQLKQAEQAPDYSQQVRWVVEQHLSAGSPSIGLVAKELGVSVRTLQRRITNEGHNFKGLLNQVRLTLAKQYLAEPLLALNEIAVLLGYEDQNSFLRAFKQLAGVTPTDWRQRHA